MNRKTLGGSKSAKRTTKAVSPARGAKPKAGKVVEPAVSVRGQRRACEAPNCNKRFPAYVARQRFCSDACRFRKFYWDYKNATGERYGARYEAARVTATRGRKGGKTTGRATPATRRAPAAAVRKPAAAKKATKR